MAGSARAVPEADLSTGSPLIVALHGGGVTPELWDGVRQELPEVELFAPELLGYVDESGSPAAVVDRLEALLPADRQVVVAGCSVGSGLALSLAARLGPRARGLLLLSPSPVIIDEPFRERLRGLRALFASDGSGELLEATIPMMLYPFGANAAAAIPLLRQMLARRQGRISTPLLDVAIALPSPEEHLGDVRCPVVVMYGAFDSFVAPGWADAWRARIGFERVRVVPAAGHQLPLEVPRDVAAALRALMAGTPPIGG